MIYWECGMCHITTFGDWEAESRPHESNREDDWEPLCKLCTIEVKKDFVEDEKNESEDYTKGSY